MSSEFTAECKNIAHHMVFSDHHQGALFIQFSIHGFRKAAGRAGMSSGAAAAASSYSSSSLDEVIKLGPKRGDSVLGEVVFVVKLAEVALAAVAEYCHDGVAWTELPRCLYGPHAVDAGRGAFWGEATGRGEVTWSILRRNWQKMQVLPMSKQSLIVFRVRGC